MVQVENNQLTTDKSYLRMAFVESQKSVAIRLKVGAIIVKNDRIISNGYNHQPSYLSKVCETIRDYERTPYFNDDIEIDYLKTQPIDSLSSKKTVIHAECSAINKLKNNDYCEGATIYVSHCPCPNCASEIVKAKIKRVVYSIDYRSKEGLEILRNGGIQVDKIECCDF